MNLKTQYLGFELPHPLMVGASPLVDDLDTVRRLEDAGAAAIVMHSLFEEQITREQWGTVLDLEVHNANSAEALSYFPEPEEYHLGPEKYLNQIRKIKKAVKIPLIASLNGVSATGWLNYARQIEQAGADGLELNVYYMPTDINEKGADVEVRTLEVVRTVKHVVKLPLAVKISPFHSSIPHFVSDLQAAGADAVVLFNRFFQPDIDPENLEAKPILKFSDSSDLLLRLRWLAILHGQVKAGLIASGGVTNAMDAIKCVMAGADGIQMVSSLLRNGPKHLTHVLNGMTQFMEQHEYESLSQMRGNMSLLRCPNPLAFTRANYMRILTGWRPDQA